MFVHVEFLRNNDYPEKIRVITDQTRTEPRTEGKGIWDNTHAGEELAIYIRSLGFAMPIIVYTGEVGIIITRYITHISNAGSTCLESIIREYIEGLAGMNNSGRWAQFHAGGQLESKEKSNA